MDHIGMAVMHGLCYQEAGKMRLIDADKYCDFLNTYPLEKAQNDFMPFYREALQKTFECEVEAIPLDWITKWTEKFFKDINGRLYYTGDGYDTVWDLLEAWEKENGED